MASTNASTSAKKRKRQSMGEGTSQAAAAAAAPSVLAVSVTTPQTGYAGPVLASFPAMVPPRETPFTLYGSDVSDKDTILAGQTEKLDFESSNNRFLSGGGNEEERAGEEEEYPCRYYLAVHNKRARTLTLQSAPLHTISTTVSSLRSLPPLASTAGAPAGSRISANEAARRLLGTTFGTKKALRNIRAAERAVIDPSLLGTTNEETLHSLLAAATADLPTQEAVNKFAEAALPIPLINWEAEKPEEVYSLEDVLGEREVKSLDKAREEIWACDNDEERARMLPFAQSEWVREKIRMSKEKSASAIKGTEAERAERRKTNMLLAVSVLMTLIGKQKGFARSLGMVRIAGRPMPAILKEAIKDKFTEKGREGEQLYTTSFTEAKLMSHMVVLVLMIDNFSSELSVLANDLHMPPAKLGDVFKSVGCKVVALKEGATTSIASKAKTEKRATLEVPIQLPKIRRQLARR